MNSQTKQENKKPTKSTEAVEATSQPFEASTVSMWRLKCAAPTKKEKHTIASASVGVPHNRSMRLLCRCKAMQGGRTKVDQTSAFRAIMIKKEHNDAANVAAFAARKGTLTRFECRCIASNITNKDTNVATTTTTTLLSAHGNQSAFCSRIAHAAKAPAAAATATCGHKARLEELNFALPSVVGSSVPKWYHAHASRFTAEEALATATTGTYLVRKASIDNFGAKQELALSHVCSLSIRVPMDARWAKTIVKHYRIDQDRSSRMFELANAMPMSNRLQFPTIQALVSFFETCPPSRTDGILLAFPCSSIATDVAEYAQLTASPPNIWALQKARQIASIARAKLQGSELLQPAPVLY
jgi:hypothetical protein